MTLPGFTATDSCYRPRQFYAGTPRAQSSRGGDGIVPAEYRCDTYPDKTVCTCDGYDNCIGMFGTSTCSAVAVCDGSLGADHPVCGCVAN
jgi:hypothetical protein